MCIFLVVVIAADILEDDAEDMSENDVVDDDVDDDIHDVEDVDADDDVDDVDDVDVDDDVDEEKEEEDEDEETDSREKSNNPNLKGGEKTCAFSLCKFKSVLIYKRIAKPFVLPLQIFASITNNTSFSQNSNETRRI